MFRLKAELQTKKGAAENLSAAPVGLSVYEGLSVLNKNPILRIEHLGCTLSNHWVGDIADVFKGGQVKEVAVNKRID